MTEKCKFYESNPTQECRLTRDVCELAHCDSHNFREDCFTYSMRDVYPNHKRETRVSARAFSRLKPKVIYMSHRYEGRSVVCPKCKQVGKLVRRTRSHVRRRTIKSGTYWQVRHGDSYCYIGTSLTSSLIKQLRREQHES